MIMTLNSGLNMQPPCHPGSASEAVLRTRLDRDAARHATAL